MGCNNKGAGRYPALALSAIFGLLLAMFSLSLCKAPWLSAAELDHRENLTGRSLRSFRSDHSSHLDVTETAGDLAQ